MRKLRQRGRCQAGLCVSIQGTQPVGQLALQQTSLAFDITLLPARLAGRQLALFDLATHCFFPF